MRCESCCKFVSMENAEPEVNSLDASFSGTVVTVSLDYRHVRACADCGQDLKDINETEELEVGIEDFSGYEEATEKARDAVKAALEDGSAEVEVEEDGSDVSEAGGGRYQKNLITVSVSFNLTVKAGDYEIKHTGTLSAERAASEYCEC